MKNHELIKKQEEEIEEQRKAMEEKRLKEEAEEKARLHEEMKAIRRRKMSEMPDEPSDGSEGVIKLAFRLPSGSRVFRNFNTTDKLQVSFRFIFNLLTHAIVGLRLHLRDGGYWYGEPSCQY